MTLPFDPLQSEPAEAPVKAPWETPEVQDMSVGKNTFNGGPTYLDTGAFDSTPS